MKNIIILGLFAVLVASLSWTGVAMAETADPGTAESNTEDAGPSFHSALSIQSVPGLKLEEPDPVGSPGVTFFGHGGYSADGLGQAGDGGTIQAQIPAGSKIEEAYLYASNNFCRPADEEVSLDGTDYHVVMLPNNHHNFLTPYVYTGADLKAQVAAKYASDGPGIINFVVGKDTACIDGVGLVVIYSNPASPEVSVAVMDGGLASAGETTILGLGSPLDTTVAGFSSQMSLGIGFSFQGFGGDIHQCGTGQFSTVDVNGQRLTSCAGNYDDGGPFNGGLITVGGVGDDLNNPPNPNGPGGEDDELYNITPFLHKGDTQITLVTQNTSTDDLIFLAIFQITARVSVGEICGDGIDNNGNGLIDEGCNVNIISSTTATSQVAPGGLAHDSAVLGGKDVPQGTITFKAFFNDPTCTEVGPESVKTTAVNPVFTSVVPVDGSGTYASEDYTTTDVGTLYWIASYSGDANNAPFTTSCNDKGESTIVAIRNHHDETNVPPPSLTGHGDDFHISDGFTIAGDSYTIPGNLVKIPTHNLVKNVPQTIVAKTYTDSQLGLEVTHISLNIGPHPMTNIGKSLLSLTWDKATGLTVTDPQGFVTDVNVNKQTQGNVDILTFTFTPLKDLSTSDVLVRAWNNKLASIDYIMQNAVKFTGEFLSPSPSQLPDTLKVYDNMADLQKQLDSDGYAKPQILSHIHDASSVFNGAPGKIYWFYDTQAKTVSLVVEDENNKVLNMQIGALVPKTQQPQNENFLLGNISYSHHSLSRNSVDELETAKSLEQLKALNLMMQLYGRNYLVQYHFLGQ